MARGGIVLLLLLLLCCPGCSGKSAEEGTYQITSPSQLRAPTGKKASPPPKLPGR